MNETAKTRQFARDSFADALRAMGGAASVEKSGRYTVVVETGDGKLARAASELALASRTREVVTDTNGMTGRFTVKAVF